MVQQGKIKQNQKEKEMWVLMRQPIITALLETTT